MPREDNGTKVSGKRMRDERRLRIMRVAACQVTLGFPKDAMNSAKRRKGNAVVNPVWRASGNRLTADERRP